MRVVLVVPAFPMLSETFIVSKFLGLLERGWDVHVVCGESSPAEWSHFPELQQREEMRDRVHVTWPVRPRALAGALAPVAIGQCATSQPGKTWQYLQEGRRHFGLHVLQRLYLDAQLVALQPDLLHFEFGTLAAGRMYVKELLGCRAVVSFRGYDINYVGLEDPSYYQDVWDKADALHLLGEDLWKRALRRGCPPEKHHVLIPPAIDACMFDPGGRQHTDVAGLPERPLRILSVGRLAWKKGYEYALEAVRHLVVRGVPCDYTIVGDGSYLEAIAFARHQLGLETCVHLVRAQPRDEVKSHMMKADVFLHAAVSEGFCNAVLEAQAMQLPVVCSDADGLPENVLDGETGFVVPRRDAQALADRLAVLAENPPLRQQMGQAGRKRVRCLFERSKQISRFDGLYKQVLYTGT